MITLDTSALVALIDPTDDKHLDAASHFRGTEGPYIVPAGILAEVAYMVERAGSQKLDLLLLDFVRGSYRLDCGDHDLMRIRGLVSRYRNLPLGFADAAVIACAERNGGRTMTFDRRDFDIVAREQPITIEP